VPLTRFPAFMACFAMPLDAHTAGSLQLGHNGGPPLEPGASWRRYCWKKAHAAAWQTPPREIALRRLKRAEALGMSYRDYTAVILDTGKLL
jgi:hypothetical protein